MCIATPKGRSDQPLKIRLRALPWLVFVLVAAMTMGLAAVLRMVRSACCSRQSNSA